MATDEITNICLMGMMLCRDINLDTQTHEPQRPDWGVPASPIVLQDELRRQIRAAGKPIMTTFPPFQLLLVVCGGKANEEFTVNVRIGEYGPEGTPFETRKLTWPPQQSWFPIVFPVHIGHAIEDRDGTFFVAFAVLINGIPMGRVLMPVMWENDFQRPPQPT
jgi:hypothetical protein